MINVRKNLKRTRNEERKSLFNENYNRESQKECDNGNNDNDQNIYASMTRMSGNDKSSSRYFGESSNLTNRILDLEATCHMTQHVSDFIPGSLEFTDKCIEVSDGHHATAKQKGKVQIKRCNDNVDTFIATFHHIRLAPDLWDGLF